MLLAMTGGLVWRFLQDEVAKSAVAALTSLYGTKFQYGSIYTTICKWVHGLRVWPQEEAQLAFLPEGASLLEEVAKGAWIWERLTTAGSVGRGALF